jgi:hypothetical protein
MLRLNPELNHNPRPIGRPVKKTRRQMLFKVDVEENSEEKSEERDWGAALTPKTNYNKNLSKN